MARRVRRKKKNIVALLCAALALMTVGIGAVAVLAAGDAPFALNKAQIAVKLPERNEGSLLDGDKASSEQGAESGGSSEGGENPQKTAKDKLFPDELRAVTIKAGVDFSLSGDEQKQRASIDAALEEVAGLTMNAVVIDTLSESGKLIYASSFLPCVEPGEFDPLAYAIESAKNHGLYSYVIYYITDVSFSEEPSVLGRASANLISSVTKDIEGFSKRYAPDAVMADGYYNIQTKKSYSNYLALGGGMGYGDYMQYVPEALVRIVGETMSENASGITFGLLTQAVWANDYEDEQGSATKARFSAMADGNADTLALMNEGLVDFVAVQAYGSIDDKNIPYKTVAAWWSDKCNEVGLPFYVVHAANKAATEETGWSEYDQLARQVIDARELPAYGGSVFNSLERLLENPKESATKLIGYFEGSVKAEHIMQDLEITRPGQRTFTSFDPTVLFAGNTDPNTDATINDTEIKTDENGYFQLEMQLSEGDNIFVINHKGKTVTYNITRITEVIKEVSPGSGTLNIDGGTRVTIDAVAYAEANVYAVVGGVTVPMQRSDMQDNDEYRDTAYARFSGVYTAPDAASEIQALGSINVCGEWNGITKNKYGAQINVNKRMLPSDGTPVVVTAELAETFPGNTVSQYSEPTYFPLPKGSLDYVVGDEVKYTFTNDKGVRQTYSFYRLQSGLRVFAEDIEAVSTSKAAVGNAITGCTVTSDANYTKVILKTRQQVSYNADYATGKITFKFNYTNSMPDSMKLNSNPWFSAVNFTKDTMTLVLANDNHLMGMYPYYDNDGNLVLRFNNPPASLNGARIAIDPGHGGSDPGALGYLSAYPERVINYAIASKLAATLKNKGANVYMLNTQGNTYSLEQRVAFAAKNNPQIFVSVHSNSSTYSPSAAGTEAYYYNYWSTGLAQFVSKNVASALGTTNRGQKHGYFYVTRSTRYPAILVETGFMSNQTEYHKLIDDGYQSNVAAAISNGISRYISYMNEEGRLTGTQTSGSAVSDAGQNANADKSLADNGISSQSQSSAQASSTGDGELSLDADEIQLEIGDSDELTALWNGSGSVEITWSAEGDGDSATLEASGDKLKITAKKAGRLKVIATAKGSGASAGCVIVIE